MIHKIFRLLKFIKRSTFTHVTADKYLLWSTNYQSHFIFINCPQNERKLSAQLMIDRCGIFFCYLCKNNYELLASLSFFLITYHIRNAFLVILKVIQLCSFPLTQLHIWAPISGSHCSASQLSSSGFQLTHLSSLQFLCMLIYSLNFL